MSLSPGDKVAVVGSGVSGLASAWLLHHHGADVTVFERESTCGGHTLTDDSTAWPIDLGFQVGALLLCAPKRADMLTVTVTGSSS